MSELAILALGLLLGVRHAFDTDHLVAVTTIVGEYRNPLRAIWIGVSWGLGHTTTLFLAGEILLFLNVHIPERLALSFEFLVGVMLILLGIQAFMSSRRLQMHVHAHHHDDSETKVHEHFHVHGTSAEHTHHHPSRWENLGRFLIAGITPGEHRYLDSPKRATKPFFRLKSYLVGIVHGLAGSATLMLLVLTNVRSPLLGVGYILIFGFGTVISMGLVSILISLPFSLTGRVPRLNRAIQAVTGAASIVFGLVLMYQVGITEGLFTGM
ncbi:MAG: urease accessory protein UreH [Chloroflexi bacterium]|nr:urease accessory protein UreH [Chloroflexota bacterium]